PPGVAALGQGLPLGGEELLELVNGRVVEAGVGLGLAPEPVELAELVSARRLASAAELDLEAAEVGEGAGLEVGHRGLDALGVADAPDRRRLLREALEAPPDADDGLVAQGLDQGLERRDVGVVAGRRRRGRLIVQEQRAGGLLPGVLVEQAV